MSDPSPPVHTRELRVAVSRGELVGDLVEPFDNRGLVVFAHGSGSSRHSPRNRHVAEQLQQAGLATLLIDLLTVEEDLDRAARFDIDQLAERVIVALDEVGAAAKGPVGLFGASTGAAAALVATAARPDEVAAVVSRGGRPDLAGSVVTSVRAPTLLIVGGDDREVLDLNRSVLPALAGESALEIVPGATHLFEEPGALDAVADLAGAWFLRHLAPREPR